MAAVAYELGQPLEVVELDLAGPEADEVLVRFTHAGLCHSDLRMSDLGSDARLPLVLGHEGSGVVEEVGPGVTGLKPGDHFVSSFVPVCGTCRWCATGQQAMCDKGALIHSGMLPSGRFPFTGPGPVKEHGAFCLVGAFSQFSTVHQNSVVKIDTSAPLDKAALLACAVPTGWGSAVNTAGVRPGDTVVIVGIGGVGINAVQGAKHAGARHILCVDPIAFKRAQALEFGATGVFETVTEAADAARSHTNGNGADKLILTADDLPPSLVKECLSATGKGGVLVLTGISSSVNNVQISGSDITYFKRTVKGSLFGDCNPTVDIPRLLNLYLDGTIKIDESITRTYDLADINDAYEDVRDGRNLRGMIVH